MLATALLLIARLVPGPAPDSKATEVRLRQPVALAGSPDGSRLFVANRRSGSLSVIEAAGGRVVAEWDVAKDLGALATGPDGRLLAIDREADALLVLRPGDGSIEARIPVAPDPASLAVAPDGSTVVVASTASNKLTVVGLKSAGQLDPKPVRAIDLPFPPRLLAWAGPKLVACDAFGGRVAVVDAARGIVESVRLLPAHNIRGLAISPDGRSLAVAHQSLSRLAQASFEDVHWGSLVGNHLRILDTAVVLDPGSDLLEGSKTIDLGRVGRAAGDPGAIAVARQGRWFVALSGVDEVARIADPKSTDADRIKVGRGPLALLTSPDGKLLHVANAFDDTITTIDATSDQILRTIPLGPRPELGPVDRGERLFADARVSHDGWMSCQSCHTDGQTNGGLADTLSDGGFGTPKRVSSLLGVGSTGPWTWLGTTDRLEDQVRKSVESTMSGRPPTVEQVNDLTAYLRSLPPPRVVLPKTLDEAATRGQALFQARKCARCHAPPEYTAPGTFDVGLLDEAGHREFNPPSLRGVAARPPYLHDGRAAGLVDLFRDHHHPGQSSYSPGEVDDLAAFLKTL